MVVFREGEGGGMGRAPAESTAGGSYICALAVMTKEVDNRILVSGRQAGGSCQGEPPPWRRLLSLEAPSWLPPSAHSAGWE